MVGHACLRSLVSKELMRNANNSRPAGATPPPVLPPKGQVPWVPYIVPKSGVCVRQERAAQGLTGAMEVMSACLVRMSLPLIIFVIP